MLTVWLNSVAFKYGVRRFKQHETMSKETKTENAQGNGDLADVSGMLPDQTKRHIDLAYLTGVFNVVGIDGLQKELTRLKEIGKKPHDIFCEGNDR